MKAIKYKVDGSKGGDLDLPAQVFVESYKKSLIYAVLRAERANRRQGTHKTKERGEVSGGGKKPWRQKGTGNARQGTIRAPQWRGGGTVFGPRPRSYRVDLPAKVRRAGIRAIFGSKAQGSAVGVIEDLKFEKFSTKAAYGIFKKMDMVPSGTVAFVVSDADEKLLRSVGNIPFIRCLDASRLTAPELFYSDWLLFTESALAKVSEKYGGED